MRTQVSCQQSGCETGTQLTDIMEGRLEDKEDRRHSLTAQYNKNGTYRLETRCAKYTHTHTGKPNEEAVVTCGSVSEQLFCPRWALQPHLHTQLNNHPSLKYSLPEVGFWNGRVLNRENSYCQDTEVTEKGIHIQHSSRHQQDTQLPL